MSVGHDGDTAGQGTPTHVHLPASALSAGDAYHLMTSLVAPRPIAWVSTVGRDGRANLAPFSYYQAVCSRPPTVVLGLGWRADGTPKDTLANLLATREFTICHVDRAHAAAMNRTSADVPPEVDEWGLAGEDGAPLPSAASHTVAPPRVRDAHAALECRLVHALPLGKGPTGMPSSTLVIGEVAAFAVRRTLLRRNARGRLSPVDPALLDSVGRLGGIAYTTTTDRVALPRPVVPVEPVDPKDPP